jgi:hypothetical protein
MNGRLFCVHWHHPQLEVIISFSTFSNPVDALYRRIPGLFTVSHRRQDQGQIPGEQGFPLG